MGPEINRLKTVGYRDRSGRNPISIQLKEVLLCMKDVLQKAFQLSRYYDRQQKKCIYAVGPFNGQTAKISEIVQRVLPGCTSERHISSEEQVIACLTGLNVRTVQNAFRRLQECGGTLAEPESAGRRRKKRPLEAAGAHIDRNCRTRLDDLPKARGDNDPLLDFLDAEAPIPEQTAITNPGERSERSREANGLLLANLAARFYTDPHLPISAFTPMLSWLDSQWPGCIGQTNHTRDFVLRFGRTMTLHLDLCSTLQHWQIVPALRLPSDFARVIDGYTCMGEPLLIEVHCLTNAQGEMTWQLVGLSPNAATAVKGNRQEGAPLHQWKSGACVAEHVIALEGGLSMNPVDMVFRHATTNGDGGYVGPKSNNLVHHWAKSLLSQAIALPPRVEGAVRRLLNSPKDDLAWETYCEFHGLQNAGATADRLFIAAKEFDELLRFLKARYSYYSGKNTLRACCRSLQIQYREVLAPRADNFKVTNYAGEYNRRFLHLFRALILALKVDLATLYTRAQTEARALYEQRLAMWESKSDTAPKRRPREPRADVGLRLKEAFKLRETGRSMLCVSTLVFGLGRGDLRNAFLIRYSVLTQKMNISRIVKFRELTEMLEAMSIGVQHLCQLAGAIRMLRHFRHDHYNCGRWRLGANALRLHIKVFSGHYGWRLIPSAVRMLPDILVPPLGENNSQKPAMFQCTNLIDKLFSEPDAPPRGPHSSDLWTKAADAISDLARFLRVEIGQVRLRFGQLGNF